MTRFFSLFRRMARRGIDLRFLDDPPEAPLNLISVNSISRIRGDRTLFEDVSFGIGEGEKVALIGANGSGKSTLLRILMGTEETDSGEVVRTRGLRIGFLEQSPVALKGETMGEFLFRNASENLQVVKGLLECEETNPDDCSSLRDEARTLNMLETARQAKELQEILGLPPFGTPAAELSGGMLRKAALARVLLEENDLLFLDEPTNHLDMESIQWMENFLIDDPRALFLITHDRYFLDRITNIIIELENGNVHTHQGGYSSFLEAREALRRERAESEAKAKNFLRKEIDWIRRQPKARGTKQKARIDRYNAVVNRDVYREPEEIKLSTNAARQGKRILELKEVSANRGERTIFSDFSYTFMARDRVGIVGPNGAGKSTLLEVIAGKLDPASGVRDAGQNTVIAYFDQMNRDLNPEERVIDYIKREAGHTITGEKDEKISAGDMLERFLFTPAIQYSPIGKLSGGERRRLFLVRLLMTGPNFLIFDEPTNDLDVQTLSVLEDFLDEFPGSVIIVSHDRWFLDRVASHLFFMDGSGSIKGFPGSCSEFLEWEEIEKLKRQQTTETQEPEAPVEEPTENRSKQSKLNRKERVLLRELEKKIETLEQEKGTLEAILSGGSSDASALADAASRHGKIETELETVFLEWEELASRDS